MLFAGPNPKDVTHTCLDPFLSVGCGPFVGLQGSTYVLPAAMGRSASRSRDGAASGGGGSGKDGNSKRTSAMMMHPSEVEDRELRFKEAKIPKS